MMFVGIALHATVLAVLAFFVLFAASKADGFVKLLGMILGAWLLLLMVGAIAIGAWHCLHPDADRDHMHHDWMFILLVGGPPAPRPPCVGAPAAPVAPAASPKKG